MINILFFGLDLYYRIFSREGLGIERDSYMIITSYNVPFRAYSSYLELDEESYFFQWPLRLNALSIGL